jgi:hypothetical protein
MWVFGVGFPKSLNIIKAMKDEICRCQGSEEAASDMQCDEILFEGLSEQDIHGSMLREEPSQSSPWGEEFSLERRRDVSQTARELRECALRSLPAGISNDGESGRVRYGASACDDALGRATADADGMRSSHSRPRPVEQSAHESGIMAGQPQSQNGGAWPHCARCGKPIVPDGLGSALKPAYEPICLARKPLSEGTVAANVLKWGTGAINIGATRIESAGKTPAPVGNFVGSKIGSNGHSSLRDGSSDHLGRWPANLCHDGSDEVVEMFPETGVSSGGSGSAARFFYCAKASAKDRAGSKHPTVKPLALMRWLVRLVTPLDGLILDPFAGTGSTAQAAYEEGFNAVLIEREEEYRQDIERRMSLLEKHGD